MAFDHPGISSGEDPRGESDKDRSGLSWIAEYVFGPEYVFGHIILMSTFRTMDVFGHGCHSKLRSLSSRIQNQDSRGFHAHMPRVASLRPPSRPLDGSWIFRMKPPTAPPHTELGSSRPSREMTVDSPLHEPSISQGLVPSKP